MDANNTSFFDESVEDESITLSDNELNNILEDSGLDNADTSFINEEPDVIVVDKSNLNEQDLNTSGTIEIDKNDFVEESVDTPQQEAALESDNISIQDVEFEDMVEDTKTDLPDIETLPEEPADNTNTETVEEVSLEEALPAESPSTETVEEVSLEEALPAESVSTESVEEVSLEEALPAESPSTETVEEVSLEEALPAESPSTETVEEVSLEEALPAESVSTESVEEVSLEEALPAESPSTETVEEVSLEEALPAESPSTETVEEVSLEEALPVENTSTESVEEVSLEEALPEENTSTETVEEVSLEEVLPAESIANTEVSAEEINDSSTISEPLYNDEAEGNTTLPEEDTNNSFFEDNDEDESITLNTEELNNILGDVETKENEVKSEPSVEVSSDTVLSTNEPEVIESQSEIKTEAEEVLEQTPKFSSQNLGSISEDTLKEIFVYLDNLLEKLPDDEIRKFAESHYYDLYNQIFEKLNLI